MAVQPQTPYIEHIANGTTTGFNLGFDCDDQDHLIVLVDDVEPVVGTWSLSGGAVVFGTAPTTGKQIAIQRNTPFRRDEDFQSYDNSFRPPGVNKGLDKVWLKLQELGVADWILSNRIDALKSYVNQQDGILQDSIDSLKNYVDDKDDELRNYLLNAIQEQGVALDQLEEYYSYLMQQLAQVAIDRGWAASFIVSADGSTQQEINDFGGAKWRNKPLGYDIGSTVKLDNGDIVKSTEPNNTKNPNVDMTGWFKVGNLVIINTVAEMVTKKLKNGDVVKTLGYNNLFDDGGGAIYLVSSVATNYSIPLLNGLHAVFRDTFDIRKFGIVGSKTLDQTENIRRMIAYADSREYEIDFHNYEIMTPDIIQYTVGQGTGTIYRGMGFNHPHKIKNIKPVNNKSIPIYQGTIPIQFLPKNKGSGETFELENVRFDLYVADQIFVSGEGDGRFHGFYAGWHPDYPVGWPDHLRSECGYKFKANGIYADTPAVTSTLALNLWFSDIELKNMFGDFIGYYTTIFGTRVTAENCHGTYRDDLHAAGRLLVTNLFQEEQEVGGGGFIYSQDHQKFKNISSRKYSTGEIHGAIKRQIMGLPTLGKFEAEDIVGWVEWQSTGQNLLINEIDISKANNVKITCSFEKATLRDLTVSGYVFANPNATHGELILDSVIVNFPVAAAVSLPSVELVNGCKVYNVIVDSGTQVTNITAKNLKSYIYRMLIGNINSIYLDDWHHTPSGTFTSSCINTSAVSSKITIINSNIQDPQALTASNAFIKAVNTDANTKLDLNVINTYMTQKPGLRLGLGVLNWVNSSPQLPAEFVYDPPSLAAAGTAGDSTTTTVTLNGAVVGDNVSAAFSLYNSGIRIYPVVSAANTVTVEFRNISAAPIDLGSGILAVKLI